MGERLWPLDVALLEVAVSEARLGAAEGGVPIGAALVADGEVIGSGRNRRIQDGSPIHHGETDALASAGRLPASIYARATMYTTLSPCSMCTGAILLYGIPRVVIGENRTFRGREEWLREAGVEVVVADDPRCIDLMETFVRTRPHDWFEDIGEEVGANR